MVHDHIGHGRCLEQQLGRAKWGQRLQLKGGTCSRSGALLATVLLSKTEFTASGYHAVMMSLFLDSTLFPEHVEKTTPFSVDSQASLRIRYIGLACSP